MAPPPPTTTIIVLTDSSSDEEEKPSYGGLVDSSVYRDALASALAMVSPLDGASAVTAEPQKKKKQVNSFDRRVREEEVRSLGVRAGASTQTKLASRKSVLPLEARRPMAERQLPFTNKRTPVVSLSSSSSSDSSSGSESRVLTPRVCTRSSSKAPLHKRLPRFDEQQIRSRHDAGIRTEPTPPRIADPPARPLTPPARPLGAAVEEDQRYVEFRFSDGECPWISCHETHVSKVGRPSADGRVRIIFVGGNHARPPTTTSVGVVFQHGCDRVRRYPSSRS